MGRNKILTRHSVFKMRQERKRKVNKPTYIGLKVGLLALIVLVLSMIIAWGVLYEAPVGLIRKAFGL